MARIFGVLAAPGRPIDSAKLAGYQRGLEKISANGTALKAGIWTSPDKSCSVISVESERSPFRSFYEKEIQMLYILEGTAYWGEKIATVADIAKLHQSKGTRFANDLEGGFCIILVDLKNHHVFMIKDRFGPKPMFYTVHDQAFYFSSYPSLLAEVATGKREWDKRIVTLYAASHYAVSFGHRETFFKNVHQLFAATILEWDGREVRFSEYWSLGKDAPFMESEPEDRMASKLAELFEAAVQKRRVTLKDYAISLSGGMDSNTVLGFLVKLSGEKQKAISVTYKEKERANEGDLIEPVAKQYVSQWHNVMPTFSEFEQEFRNIYTVYDQPWTTSTVYAQQALMKKAGQLGLSTLVSGSGGDHLMGGAYPCFLYYFAYLRQSGQEDLLKAEVNKWIEHHSVAPWKKTFQTVETFFSEYIDMKQPGRILQPWVELSPEASVLSPEYRRDYRMPEPVESYGDYPRTYTIQELHRCAFPPALWAEDVMGWQNGVSGCDPLLDRELYEYCWKIPHRYKIRDGMNKILMRQATKGIVPDHIRLRVAKTGFNLPFDTWLRTGLSELAGDIFHSKSFTTRGILDVKNVQALWEAHKAEKVQQGMLIWQLLNLELWFRSWIDK